MLLKLRENGHLVNASLELSNAGLVLELEGQITIGLDSELLRHFELVRAADEELMALRRIGLNVVSVREWVQQFRPIPPRGADDE